MRTAWFHPFSGIAGDMALGALIDAGADVETITEMLETLHLDGWELSREPVLRGGIAGTKVHVHMARTSVVRTAASIDALVAQATLPERVRDRARLIFAALAQAEGRLHRSAPAQVHFHEVGGTDAIIDVVGTCAALEILDIDTVASGTVVTGNGMVRAAHGIIPNPSPATVELLAGAPTRGIDVPVELTTPTGAAILAALVDTWGPMPALRIDAHGFGAGTRQLDHRPNLCQVVIGEADPTGLDEGQPVVLLATNVDDVTGEVLAHTINALLQAGAHDAWLTPVMMKKGRPGHVVHALADVAVAESVRQVLVSETGSLGVRGQYLARWPETRHVETVDSEIGAMRIKVSAARTKAEFDDAVRLADARRAPLREVQRELEESWRHGHPHDHTDGHGHDHVHHHDDGHHHEISWHEEGPADPVA